MIGINRLLQMGVAKFAHHTVVVFYAIAICVLLYRPINRLYMFNCSRRKVNVVSRRLPVSVWSIVSREIILLPAELIPLPGEANRSRPSELGFESPFATVSEIGHFRSLH